MMLHDDNTHNFLFHLGIVRFMRTIKSSAYRMSLFTYKYAFMLLIGCGYSKNIDVSKKYGIQYFGQCQDVETPFFITEGKINTYSKKNRTVVLKIDLNKKIVPDTTKLNIWRCANIENPDTCEHYMKDFVVRDICEKINSGSEDQIWVNAFKHVTPEIKCPLEPAQYISQFQLEISESLLLRIVPFPSGFWKLRGTTYEGDEMVACADLTFKVNKKY